MNGKKLGFALCGSFCTLERTLKTMAELAAAGWDIQPIMSPITYETDTRFGAAEQWRDRVEGLCGRPIWHTVPQVEPIGPRKLLDILLVAPCTGNTLGKLANGITDTPVTMAVTTLSLPLPLGAVLAAAAIRSATINTASFSAFSIYLIILVLLLNNSFSIIITLMGYSK